MIVSYNSLNISWSSRTISEWCEIKKGCLQRRVSAAGTCADRLTIDDDVVVVVLGSHSKARNFHPYIGFPPAAHPVIVAAASNWTLSNWRTVRISDIKRESPGASGGAHNNSLSILVG